jgi:hypothetical protein
MSWFRRFRWTAHLGDLSVPERIGAGLQAEVVSGESGVGLSTRLKKPGLLLRRLEMVKAVPVLRELF